MSVDESPFRVLMVCTANICRSATAQLTLSAYLDAHRPLAEVPLAEVEVMSAGVAAVAGYPMCDTSSQLLVAAVAESAVNAEVDVLALAPDATRAHVSRRLTPELVLDADLVLTADRSHRGAVVQLAPSARSRVFTLRQAAQLAIWIVGDSEILPVAGELAAGRANPFPADDPRALTAPLPTGARARLTWLVEEMDANRGMAPRNVAALETQLDSAAWHEDDVEDPHVAGWALHESSVATIMTAVADIGSAMLAAQAGSRRRD